MTDSGAKNPGEKRRPRGRAAPSRCDVRPTRGYARRTTLREATGSRSRLARQVLRVEFCVGSAMQADKASVEEDMPPPCSSPSIARIEDERSAQQEHSASNTRGSSDKLGGSPQDNLIYCSTPPGPASAQEVSLRGSAAAALSPLGR